MNRVDQRVVNGRQMEASAIAAVPPTRSEFRCEWQNRLASGWTNSGRFVVITFIQRLTIRRERRPRIVPPLMPPLPGSATPSPVILEYSREDGD
jgi:hypothetical protein